MSTHKHCKEMPIHQTASVLTDALFLKLVDLYAVIYNVAVTASTTDSREQHFIL